MPIHKDLTDSELHPPKGFLPASNESFPIKNASGLLEWISTSNLGSKWHTGAGLPSPALGRTGDFYLDSDVGDFYEKTNFSAWTLRGNVDGSDWFKGSGPPNPVLGRIQDFYIDIDEGDLYEKTAPTVWDLITNIDGSDWFQGAGPPAPALGREQDFYIDKTTGDLYEKNSPTTWNLFANITGPQGPVGPMANVSDDTTPELGGDLDGQGHNISNVGTYNGIIVESHASRHAPGGADPIATGAASTQAPDQANAEGNANSLARANHTHNIPTASAVGLDANSPNAQGSNPSFARSNHTHSIGTGVPVTQLPAQSNNVGSSSNLARADHIHNLPTAVPQTVGTANSEGAANSFARSDHVHSHGNQAGGLLHALVTQVLAGFMSAIDKLKLDQINIGHLSYSNSGTITTTSNTFVSVSVDADRESFSNSLFTKVNSTDFQTNFSGQVEIGYRVMAFPSTNDQGWEIGIQRNSTDISWSAVASNAKNTINRRDTPAGSVILNCAANDIFRLRLRSIEGSTITVNPDFAYMSIRVYRINS